MTAVLRTKRTYFFSSVARIIKSAASNQRNSWQGPPATSALPALPMLRNRFEFRLVMPVTPEFASYGKLAVHCCVNRSYSGHDLVDRLAQGRGTVLQHLQRVCQRRAVVVEGVGRASMPTVHLSSAVHLRGLFTFAGGSPRYRVWTRFHSQATVKGSSICSVRATPQRSVNQPRPGRSVPSCTTPLSAEGEAPMTTIQPPFRVSTVLWLPRRCSANARHGPPARSDGQWSIPTACVKTRSWLSPGSSTISSGGAGRSHPYKYRTRAPSPVANDATRQ